MFTIMVGAVPGWHSEKHLIIMLSPFYSVYLRTVSWEYIFFVVCTVVLSNGLVNTSSLFLTQ